MLRFLGGLLTAAGLAIGIPYFFGMALVAFLIGLPIYFLDNVVGLHFVSDDPAIMEIVPRSVEWTGRDGKAFTATVTNRGEPMDRFTMLCQSNAGGFTVTDLSGISTGETSTRTYAFGMMVESSTVTEVTGCRITDHIRGKPSEFNVIGDFEREGGGGWGDRLYTANGTVDYE